MERAQSSTPGRASDFGASLSVVVPVGPGERAWEGLIACLKLLPTSTEFLFVGCEASQLSETELQARFEPSCSVRWLLSERGRARQLNRGARAARGRFLWFVHADTRFELDAVLALERSIAREPEALHFFDLRFGDEGMAARSSPIMLLTEWGVRWRSRVWGLPFGDQGFCLSLRVLERLGGFSETAPYGEDHLLVWKAKQLGIRLRCTGAVLVTSARKYREHGWIRTTARHGALTWKQAFPEFVRWLRARAR